MHKSLFFFLIFVTNKIFKTLFTERDVNLDIVYQNKDFMLVNFVFFNFSVTKPYSFCVFLSILYILSKFHIIFILYDVPPFLCLNQKLIRTVNLQFQNCSLKIYTFKTAPSKNILICNFNLLFIRIIRKVFKVSSNHFIFKTLAFF